MKKIKRILVGMCMMFVLFSSDAVAQSFVDGATAITNLNQEKLALDVEAGALNQTSATYLADADRVGLRINSVGILLGYVDSGNAPSDIEALTVDVIILLSEKFSPIDPVKYDQGDYGSTEISELKTYLYGVLTN